MLPSQNFQHLSQEIQVFVSGTRDISVIFTMHELKQLVNYRLQKFPVRSQKTWILTYYIHDI